VAISDTATHRLKHARILQKLEVIRFTTGYVHIKAPPSLLFKFAWTYNISLKIVRFIFMWFLSISWLLSSNRIMSWLLYTFSGFRHFSCSCDELKSVSLCHSCCSYFLIGLSGEMFYKSSEVNLMICCFGEEMSLVTCLMFRKYWYFYFPCNYRRCQLLPVKFELRIIILSVRSKNPKNRTS
jgi:hypothetical protein